MNDDRSLATPDVSKIQWGSLVAAVVALAAAFGLDISKDKQDAIINLVTVLTPVLVIADAVIRNGRARAMITPPKGETAAPAPANNDP